MQRIHQLATIQLDFQLPLRFDLKYRTSEGGDDAYAVPVMIHRAVLGSVERMSAVLSEHWGGKWPFWLSPRQASIVPVDPKFNDYAYEVQKRVHAAGYHCQVDDSARTLNKKVREAQLEAYNLIFVVGEKEIETNSVTVRVRDMQKQEVVSVDEVIAKMDHMEKYYKEYEFNAKEGEPAAVEKVP